MKRIRYLLVLLAVSFLGSCVESTLEMEQEDETFCDSRSGNSSLDATLAYLKTTRLGGSLWDTATSRLLNNMEINFVYSPSIHRRSMKYIGEGRIVYNADGMSENGFLQLAFHELFHVLQTGVNYKQSLNDEIEAYLAQYIFLVSLGHGAKFDADDLTQIIKDLAKNIDMNTGEILHPKRFRADYEIALGVIKTMELYKNKEDEEPWIEEPHKDVPCLTRFLKYVN